MRDYIVEMIATSKKQMIVTAESAEEVGKAVELIIRNTNMVTFNNEDVAHDRESFHIDHQREPL